MNLRDRIDQGEDPREAECAVRREFGNRLLVEEVTREMWGWNWFEPLCQDIRYAMRTMSRSPGFTIVAVLTLALGIGVNSGIFTIVDAVMLRPLPYAEPDRLVSVWETLTADPPARWTTSNSGGDSRGRMPVSPANLVDYRKDNRSFTALAGEERVALNMTGNGPAERVWGERVTSDFLSILGVQPALGRGFLAEEDRPGNQYVVVISSELWQRRFGSDPNLIGNSIALDGEKYRVIGIMAPGFQTPEQFGFTERLNFWLPAAYPGELLANHGDHEIQVIGRLKAGVTVRQAQAELDSVSMRLAQQYSDSNRNVKAVAGPLSDDIARDARTSMLVLAGAVGLILLIACANLANLLMVRAVGRYREISIRVALGASRIRMISALLTQSLVLSAFGCAAGLALGVWTKQLLMKLAPAGIPRLDGAGLDGRVLLFTLLLSFATGILFGLLPAWHLSKARPDSLKSSGRSMAGAAVMRWRSALMVVEVALSMTLLIGAGLLLRSFIVLRGVDVGFETEHVMAMNVNLPETRYKTADQRFAFFDDLLARVSALPGVESAAFSNRMPMRGGWGGGFELDTSIGQDMECDFQAVSSGYFQTLGIPLLRGRLLTPADRTGAPPVAVINAEFSHAFLQTQEPLGRRFRRSPDAPWVTIVGVVADVHRGGKSAPVAAGVYLPAAQTGLYPVRLADFAFRATRDPKLLIAAVQQQTWAIDKDQPVTNVKTLDDVISLAVAPRRFQTLLLSLFAGVALLLALVGIYGVISYSVSQRTGEIGLRIALGAGRIDIVRLVIVRSMLLVMAGIAIGGAGAYGLSRYFRALLFEIKPGDPLTYAGLAVSLSVVALAACCVPACRATKVDPMVALRCE